MKEMVQMKPILCHLMLLLISTTLRAQTVREYYSEEFFFEVKSIDDFFERFNFTPSNQFNKSIKQRFPHESDLRKRAIWSLFNLYNSNSVRESDIGMFISQVADSVHPEFLDYRSSLWFAEVECRVTCLGKPAKIRLVLKVKKTPGNAYSWNVVGASGPLLSPPGNKSENGEAYHSAQVTSFDPNKIPLFISPASHGIDFINIDKFFKSRSRVHEYLYRGADSYELKKLTDLIRQGQLTYSHVSRISYFLMDFSNWIVQINYRNNPGTNSGWLIDLLIPATAADKAEFMKNRLHIAQPF